MTTVSTYQRERTEIPRLFIDAAGDVLGKPSGVHVVLQKYGGTLSSVPDAPENVCEIIGVEPTLHAAVSGELRKIGITLAPNPTPFIHRQHLAGSTPL